MLHDAINYEPGNSQTFTKCTYGVWKYRRKPHVSTIKRIVNAVDEFIRSPHITSDVTQHVYALWVCCYICQRNTNRHTTILRLSGFCPGLPGRASNRKNIHPLTPILIINEPLSASSIYCDPWHPPHSNTCPTVFLHNLYPSLLWSTSRSGTLHFILHKLLHPIIVVFSKHIPIPSHPVLLYYQDYVI